MWKSVGVPAGKHHCVYCTQVLGSAPVPIVTGQEPGGGWLVVNWACSLGCANAWHRDTRSEVGVMQQTLWAREAGLVKPGEVSPCRPPRELLDIFNGSMSRGEWEAGSGDVRHPQHVCAYADAPRGVLTPEQPVAPPARSAPAAAKKRPRAQSMSPLAALLRKRTTDAADAAAQ